MTTSALIWIHQPIQPRTTIYICAAKVSIHSFNISPALALSVKFSQSLDTVSCIQHCDPVDTECTTPVSTFNTGIESLKSLTGLQDLQA